MVHVKKFLDRVSAAEGRSQKEVVLNMSDARGLRDEVSKLLSDLYALKDEKSKKEETIKLEIKGGGFK